MRKQSRRTLPRCNAQIWPKKKYKLKNGLERTPPMPGQPNNQRCTRSIRCPHHKNRNSECPVIQEVGEAVFLTWEQVKELINNGHREVTGRNYYQDKKENNNA